MQKKGNKYGTHRVIEPKDVLTQAAKKIDNSMELYANEILVDVSALNVDSASFTQISRACGGDEEKIGAMIMDIVAERGKLQNPVTGSGGMFIGTVRQIGDDLKGKIDLEEGDKIASLVSLSLTPLKIEKILAVHKDIDRVDIAGQAILFESGIYAKLPADLSEKLSLAALDVAGAPAHLLLAFRPGAYYAKENPTKRNERRWTVPYISCPAPTTPPRRRSSRICCASWAAWSASSSPASASF